MGAEPAVARLPAIGHTASDSTGPGRDKPNVIRPVRFEAPGAVAVGRPAALCGTHRRVTTGGIMEKKKVGSVEYHEAGAEYFAKRELRKHARVWSLWALGVGAVISGHFTGWNSAGVPNMPPR